MNNKKAKDIRNSCPCDEEGNLIKNIYRNAKKYYSRNLKDGNSNSELSEFLAVQVANARYEKLHKV